MSSKTTILASMEFAPGRVAEYVFDADDLAQRRELMGAERYPTIAEGEFVPKSYDRDECNRRYRLWQAADGRLFRVYSDRSTNPHFEFVPGADDRGPEIIAAAVEGEKTTGYPMRQPSSTHTSASRMVNGDEYFVRVDAVVAGEQIGVRAVLRGVEAVAWADTLDELRGCATPAIDQVLAAVAVR